MSANTNYGPLGQQAKETPKKTRASTTTPVSGKVSESKITKTIGSGDDAKNSIVWVTVRMCFIIGSLITLAIYLRPTYCDKELNGNLIEDIKSVWAIFMPVVTLTLGYIFGKGR